MEPLYVTKKIYADTYDSISMEFFDGGVATNITTWDFYYRAVHPTTGTTITVAPASMLKSAGDGGVINVLTIPFARTITDVADGLYPHNLIGMPSTDPITFMDGNVEIVKNDVEVA